VRWAAATPERRAAVYVDQSWFVLWPRQAATWARRRRPPRVPQAKSWRRAERPPRSCLYATYDTATGQVEGEWHPTWNQQETWRHLKGMLRRSAARGTRFLVLLWDNAPWHVAQHLRRRVARYNRWAKRHGRLRVLLFFLPVRAPWLMPLEAIFGQTKRAVGPLPRETLAALQEAVEQRLARRHAATPLLRHRAHPPKSLHSS
jgi:DDE superfamily endonuclease